jgi:hypothetical protein
VRDEEALLAASSSQSVTSSGCLDKSTPAGSFLQASDLPAVSRNSLEYAILLLALTPPFPFSSSPSSLAFTSIGRSDLIRSVSELQEALIHAWLD